jgi:hypothetical protein
MRLQTMFLINVQVKKSQRIWDPLKFMPLPWDKDIPEDDLDDFIPPKINHEAFKAFIDGTKDNRGVKPGDQHADR